MLQTILFWAFQLINGLTALSMFFAPKKFHESMLKDPKTIYAKLGFSETAVEMLHNVIRGQGAALLAITIYLFVLGSGERSAYLLIALACALSLVAHIATTRHHAKSALVMDAIGSLGAMIPILAINAVVAALAAVIYSGLL